MPDDVNTNTKPAVMSFTDWLVTLFISIIPGVNILALIYWAIFSKENKTRSNFSRAYLIVAPFSILITLAMFILFLYLFGGGILNFLVEQSRPKLY